MTNASQSFIDGAASARIQSSSPSRTRASLLGLSSDQTGLPMGFAIAGVYHLIQTKGCPCQEEAHAACVTISQHTAGPTFRWGCLTQRVSHRTMCDFFKRPKYLPGCRSLLLCKPEAGSAALGQWVSTERQAMLLYWCFPSAYPEVN